MRSKGPVIAITIFILALAAASQAQVQLIEESFEAPAGWNWGLPTQVLETGGAPGAYLQSQGILDSALPKLRTTKGVASKFVGDYRAANVRGVSVTLQIGDVPTPQGRFLSVELTNDRGTPDVNDDCSAYLVGSKNIPLPGTGWKPYLFPVPSEEQVLPPGWQLLSAFGNQCPGLTDDEAWNLVITDVDQLQFSYGDPSFFYIFQQWEGLALDNPTIGVGQ